MLEEMKTGKAHGPSDVNFELIAVIVEVGVNVMVH